MPRIKYQRPKHTHSIHYFSDEHLPTLESLVNKNIEKFVNQDDGTSRDVEYSADLMDFNFMNGEYVQVVMFTTWERIKLPSPPVNRNKKTKKVEGSSLQPMET